MYQISDPQMSISHYLYEQVIDKDNQLIKIRDIFPWEEVSEKYAEQFYSGKTGRNSKNIKVMIGLHLLKEWTNLSDEKLLQQAKTDLLFKAFLGLAPDDMAGLPKDSSLLTVFRKRIGKEGQEIINQEVNKVLKKLKLIKGRKVQSDTTAITFSIPHPTDTGVVLSLISSLGRSIQNAHPTDYIKRFVGGLIKKSKNVHRNWVLFGREKKAEATKEKTEKKVEEIKETKTTENKTTANNGVANNAKENKKLEKDDKTTKNDLDKKGTKKEIIKENSLKCLQILYDNAKDLFKKGQSAKKKVQKELRVMIGQTKVKGTLLKNKSYQAKKKVLDELNLNLKLAEMVIEQTKDKLAGNTSIPDRIINYYMPSLRAIARGKIGKMFEFGLKVFLNCEDGFITSMNKVEGNLNENKCVKVSLEAHKKEFGHYPRSYAYDRGLDDDKLMEEMEGKGVAMIAQSKTGRKENKHEHTRRGKKRLRERSSVEAKIGEGKRCHGWSKVKYRSEETAIMGIQNGVTVMNLKRLVKVI